MLYTIVKPRDNPVPARQMEAPQAARPDPRRQAPALRNLQVAAVVPAEVQTLVARLEKEGYKTWTEPVPGKP